MDGGIEMHRFMQNLRFTANFFVDRPRRYTRALAFIQRTPELRWPFQLNSIFKLGARAGGRQPGNERFLSILHGYYVFYDDNPDADPWEDEGPWNKAIALMQREGWYVYTVGNVIRFNKDDGYCAASA